jgi:hypothetical protein
MAKLNPLARGLGKIHRARQSATSCAGHQGTWQNRPGARKGQVLIVRFLRPRSTQAIEMIAVEGDITLQELLPTR